MKITKENSVLLVIDIQSKLLPFINNNEELEKRCLKLIQGIQILNIPIIITEQYPKGIGLTIESIIKQLGEDYKPIEKFHFSCCGSAEFMNKLYEFNKPNVIVIGIETHVCVLQTALDLLRLNYNVYVVEDCVSSRNPNDKNVAIERIRQEGGLITTYESILFEICQISGTQEFKEISKIVK